MTAFSFSYSPKASTALANINPIQSRGEGLRFAANTPMQFLKQNPEVVTEGFWKGRQALTEGVVKGVTSALSGVAGALTSKAQEAKDEAKALKEHDRAMEIAKIKAAPTFNEELYKSNQIAIQNEQLRKLQTENNNVDIPKEDSVAEGDTSVIDEIESLISPAAKKVESAPPTQPSTSVPPTSSAPPAPPAPPAAPNAPVAPAGVSQFAPGDAGRGLFQFDQGTGTDAYGNVPPRQTNMAFNLAPLQPASVLAPTTAVASTPESAPTRSIFGKSENPNFVSLRDKISQVAAKTSEPNLFSDISAVTPPVVEPQFNKPYTLRDIQAPESPQMQYPESKGTFTLAGEQSPMMEVSGAEGKPLAETPPVEPALPQAVPTEPALATTPEPAPQRTQEQIVNQYVGLLTNKPYRGAADARRAKQVLEKLGIKAEIETEKGEKGTRLHYVKVVDEAPPAKTAPEGFITKKITDADGKETYVYEPKMPVKQQIATFDNNIKKAEVLKKTLEKIEKIAPGYLFAGAGGISGLMKYNPIANDARTTRSLLDTVKGIVGFDELVALKAQGGTLGALSDSELKMLTSLQGSIDPDMDEATFLENIKSMRESTERLISGLEADKKEVMNVEKKTNFQPIQSEKPKYEKGVTSFVKDGYKYVWDGTEFKLSK